VQFPVICTRTLSSGGMFATNTASFSAAASRMGDGPAGSIDSLDVGDSKVLTLVVT